MTDTRAAAIDAVATDHRARLTINTMWPMLARY
jgi:hypothetical protein